jgi:hypothetical protein
MEEAALEPPPTVHLPIRALVVANVVAMNAVALHRGYGFCTRWTVVNWLILLPIGLAPLLTTIAWLYRSEPMHGRQPPTGLRLMAAMVVALFYVPFALLMLWFGLTVANDGLMTHWPPSWQHPPEQSAHILLLLAQAAVTVLLLRIVGRAKSWRWPTWTVYALGWLAPAGLLGTLLAMLLTAFCVVGPTVPIAELAVGWRRYVASQGIDWVPELRIDHVTPLVPGVIEFTQVLYRGSGMVDVRLQIAGDDLLAIGKAWGEREAEELVVRIPLR